MVFYSSEDVRKMDVSMILECIERLNEKWRDADTSFLNVPFRIYLPCLFVLILFFCNYIMEIYNV